MQEILIYSITGVIIGSLSIWLHYRNKFNGVLQELEDKKLIIKAIQNHAYEIERANVKKMAKKDNTNTEKTKEKNTPNIVKTPKFTNTTKKIQK